MIGHKERVLEYVKKYGSISSMEAFGELGITRLSDVVFRLKKEGHKFDSVNEKVENRYGRMVSFTRYYLIDGE